MANTTILNLPVVVTASGNEQIPCDSTNSSATTVTKRITSAQIAGLAIGLPTTGLGALSVFGNPTTTSAATGTSILGTAGQVLRINDGGTTVAFGKINIGNRNSITGTSLQINASGQADKSAGSRGPLFIWNDPSTNSAGQNCGLQVWIGSNPTANPGANDSIAQTTYIDNLNGRGTNGGIWSHNIVAGQQSVASGGTSCIVRGMEVDVYASIAVTTASDPFTAGPAVHAIEAVASANPGGVNPQVGVWQWAADNNAGTPFQFGFASARSVLAGFVAADYTGDTASTTFTKAAFMDMSSSAYTIKVGPNLVHASTAHTGFIDFSQNPGIGNFLLGLSGAATTLNFTNSANFGMTLQLDSGSSAAQINAFTFSDRGTAKWSFIKDASNNFSFQNQNTTNTIYSINTTSDNTSWFKNFVVSSNSFFLGDASAAFNVSIRPNSSSAALTADRILTLDMGNVAHILTLGTTASTGSGIIFPNTATDTVTMIAATQELTNKTLNASVGKGTWTASGTWTLPAFTLNGTVSGGGNNVNNVIIGAVTPLAGSFTTATASTSVTVTSASANALAAGLTGATHPAFNVDASTASQTAGLNVKGAALNGTVAVSVIDTSGNTNLTIDALGSGTIQIGGTSTGAITLTRATTMSNALTYGGVTLSNSVTGTGSMVLSASPTFSGTVAGDNTIPLSILKQIATNTVLGNSTSGTANVTALAVGSCSTAGSALIWTTNTGFGCNTSITANSATTATNATNSAITNDDATNATMDLVWVTTNTGNLPLKTSSAGLNWNPSTAILTTTNYVNPGLGLLIAGVGSVTRSAGTGALTINTNAANILMTPAGGTVAITGTLSASALANAATTSAVCYNTGTGVLTYDGTLGTCTVSLLSAKDLKAPLTPKEGFDIVMAMSPWRYTMKENLPTYVAGEMIGFIAEYAAEVAIAAPFVARNHDGTLAGFRYEHFTSALAAAVKHLKADNDNLRAELEQFKIGMRA